MHELKIQSSLGYERVWNSLASLDPFPLSLFMGYQNRPSISRLRSDILPSFRVDWTEGRKRQWIILSLTNLDFLNSTMTIEVSDGQFKSLDSARFHINLASNDEGCEISLKYIAHFRFIDRILPTGAQRKLRKQILQFNFDEALKAESRFNKIFD
jgi:hypothetical protein